MSDTLVELGPGLHPTFTDSTDGETPLLEHRARSVVGGKVDELCEAGAPWIQKGNDTQDTRFFSLIAPGASQPDLLSRRRFGKR